MSEGQHIEDFIASQKFINQQKCLGFVKDARETYKTRSTTPNIEIVDNSEKPFSGPVELYTTVEKLNTYIGTFIKDQTKTESETKVVGTVSDTIPDLCGKELDEFQKDLCSWSRMKSSGSQFDCLIHTFLTMTSPNFRRLPSGQKDTLASAFRRTLFLKFPVINRASDRDEVRKRVPASGVFLTDSELQILSLTYKINFIVFEQAKKEKVGGRTMSMPATITPIDNFPDTNTFYLLSNIFKPSRHYEAVKAKDSYTVTRDTMEMILAEFPQEFTGDAKPICKYPGTDRDIEEGDIVIYNNKPCMVLQKRYSGSPPRCQTLKVQMLDTDEEEEIPVKNVKPHNSSGGRRKRLTKRRYRRKMARRSRKV